MKLSRCRLHKLCIGLFAPLLFASCAGSPQSEQSNEAPKSRLFGQRAVVDSVGGTTWSGKDSEGDFYEYTFLADGRLKYKTNTSRSQVQTFSDKGDVWSQNGRIVVILIGDTSTKVGMISGSRISGKAWNAQGRRWTWKVNKHGQ